MRLLLLLSSASPLPSRIPVFIPHSLSCLFLSLPLCRSLSLCVSMALFPTQVVISFVKHSSGTSMAALASTLTLSVLFLPEDPFYPPLKYGWRLFTGLVIFCNLCNLYALLFIHDVDTYSRTVRSVFPQSNQAVSLRTEYGVNCDPVTWQKIYTHLDIFAVAHLVGCAFKAIIFRQYEILWIYSIVWEMTEYCFVHLLPNFAECWWDRILLDVVICNGLGYYIGMQFCKMNNLHMFDWHSERISRRLITFCCVSGQRRKSPDAIFYDKDDRGKRRDRIEYECHKAKKPSRDLTCLISSTSSKHIGVSPAANAASVEETGSAGRPSMDLALAIFLSLFVGQISELNTFLYKHFFNISPHAHLMAARTTLCAVIPIPLIANLFAMTRGTQTLLTHSKFVLLLSITDTLFSIKFGLMTFPFLDFFMVSLWVSAMIILTFICIVARSVRAVFCREDCSLSAKQSTAVMYKVK